MKFEAELVNLSGENKENEKKRHSTSSVIKRDKAIIYNQTTVVNFVIK